LLVANSTVKQSKNYHGCAAFTLTLVQVWVSMCRLQ